jgi:hypothetical protein
VGTVADVVGIGRHNLRLVHGAMTDVAPPAGITPWTRRTRRRMMRRCCSPGRLARHKPAPRRRDALGARGRAGRCAGHAGLTRGDAAIGSRPAPRPRDPACPTFRASTTAAGRACRTCRPRPDSGVPRDRRAPMVRIGFHASHEQFPPSELLRLVRPERRADTVGDVRCAEAGGACSAVGSSCRRLAMSLRPSHIRPVPEGTVRVAQSRLPQGQPSPPAARRARQHRCDRRRDQPRPPGCLVPGDPACRHPHLALRRPRRLIHFANGIGHPLWTVLDPAGRPDRPGWRVVSPDGQGGGGFGRWRIHAYVAMQQHCSS